ncbi:hypothetical protein [Limnohabitans sp.]|uniref:hypothetical protein n=1 Tax=Limnohabitans sp. TaxID=1907725 RepID=UPI00333FE38A
MISILAFYLAAASLTSLSFYFMRWIAATQKLRQEWPEPVCHVPVERLLLAKGGAA